MYFTLIRESGDAYLLNESLCMPIFGLEVKNLELRYDSFNSGVYSKASSSKRSTNLRQYLLTV